MGATFVLKFFSVLPPPPAITRPRYVKGALLSFSFPPSGSETLPPFGQREVSFASPEVFPRCQISRPPPRSPHKFFFSNTAGYTLTGEGDLSGADREPNLIHSHICLQKKFGGGLSWHKAAKKSRHFQNIPRPFFICFSHVCFLT